MCQRRLNAPRDSHVADDWDAAYKYKESRAEQLSQARLYIALEEAHRGVLLFLRLDSLFKGHSK